MRFSVVVLTISFLIAAESTNAAEVERTLRFATWNMEHLADSNGEGCKARQDADYALLKSYVGQLGADVIALQEVENEQAAARVFDPDEWSIEIAYRKDQEPVVCRETSLPMITQRTGFAIRRGIPYRRNPDVIGLDIGGSNRHRGGVDITLEAGIPIRILSVHLKSGCPAGALDQPGNDACPVLEKQSKVLKEWVQERRIDQIPFMIMGDFNRRLQDEEQFWQALDMPGDALGDMTLAASKDTVAQCRAQFQKFIDHIVFNPQSLALAVPGSFQELKFAEPEDRYPSDHCPASVALKIADLCDAGEPEQCDKSGLSRGLRWFRRSPEFTAIVDYIFAQAGRRVDEIAEEMSPTEAWAVSLDADETILDNSLGQYENEYLGLGYKVDRWERWEARGAAKAIPGSITFMNGVIARGGKVAIITNRSIDHAGATYDNLVRLGLANDRAKVCILARSSADKLAGNEAEWKTYGYGNDKDRRRRLLSEGKAAGCWLNDPDGSLKGAWARPHRIPLWVGDNVLDLPKVKAPEARAKGLGPLTFGEDFFLIPNPLYGSWTKNDP